MFRSTELEGLSFIYINLSSTVHMLLVVCFFLDGVACMYHIRAMGERMYKYQSTSSIYDIRSCWVIGMNASSTSWSTFESELSNNSPTFCMASVFG